MSWDRRPVIYEVNTACWLTALARSTGREQVRLDEVDDRAWDSLAPDGVDAVWLMGVWQRSPAGLAIARGNAGLMASFHEALPDLTDDDVIGSPYCVRDYVVDDRFGGPSALAAARRALADRGLRLILDYVPNHVAPDHPWVGEHPERFIQGTAADAAAEPEGWLRVGERCLAHGRDPYFPAWPDVVQLNAFATDLRAATTDTLSTIAEQCDGIRCDMAMLMINNIFGKTWQGRTGPEPGGEFWPEVIAGLRSRHPDVVLMAEAYWDLEWELQQQGFDFCYDKRLYDRLLGGDVDGLRGHLHADLDYQSRLVRFLENHDEPRVASRVGVDQERATAVTIATLPGATLWYEGQFEGRRVRPPVFVARRPDEPVDAALAQWYHRLVAAAADVRRGDWLLFDVSGWPDNQSCRNLVAWGWDDAGGRSLVVVNLSGGDAQGRVHLPWPDVTGRTWRLADRLSGDAMERDGTEIAREGLFVALGPWQHYVLELTAGA